MGCRRDAMVRRLLDGRLGQRQFRRRELRRRRRRRQPDRTYHRRRPPLRLGWSDARREFHAHPGRRLADRKRRVRRHCRGQQHVEPERRRDFRHRRTARPTRRPRRYRRSDQDRRRRAVPARSFQSYRRHGHPDGHGGRGGADQHSRSARPVWFGRHERRRRRLARARPDQFGRRRHDLGREPDALRTWVEWHGGVALVHGRQRRQRQRVGRPGRRHARTE